MRLSIIVKIQKTILSLVLLLLATATVPVAVHAAESPPEVFFEGYFKVLAGSTHAGYAIERFQFDKKNKRFRVTTYIRTTPVAGNVTESLDAYSDDAFKPKSYQLTTVANGQAMTIDAQFNGLEMTATTSDGANARTSKKAITKEAVLSSFLRYLVLHRGLKTDTRYSYQALAEEDGNTYPGDLYIDKALVAHRGQQVYSLLNIFKGLKVQIFMNDKGEALGMRSPMQGLTTELVANPQEATQGMQVNTAHLIKLFGTVPTGQTNVVAKAGVAAPAAAAPVTAPITAAAPMEPASNAPVAVGTPSPTGP